MVGAVLGICHEQSQEGVQLVCCAVALYALAAFLDSLSADERGFPLVACPCVYFHSLSVCGVSYTVFRGFTSLLSPPFAPLKFITRELQDVTNLIFLACLQRLAP